MGAGDRRGDRKRKLQATASARGGILARKKEEKATASPSQGFGILKKRKKAMAAQDLWALEFVPGGMDTWKDRWLESKAKMEEEEEEEEAAAVARPAKRRKRVVVKQRMPKPLIDHLVVCPYKATEDLTPAQLAKRSHGYRQLHAMTAFIDGKMRDYEQALIDQYNAQGYAEDEFEREVSDSDSEEDVTVEEK